MQLWIFAQPIVKLNYVSQTANYTRNLFNSSSLRSYKPELKIQDDARPLYGLCANICREKAINLKLQLNLNATALSKVTLNEKETSACIECGALFGVKSTVERI